MSLDGYIADPYDNLDFLSMVEKDGQDYGYANFLKSVDTVIVGRKTYEKVLSMGYDYPHKDKKVYIITRSERPPVGSFTFYTGDLNELITSLKNQTGKHIYCDGGAEIVNELLRHKQIDEWIISVIPVLLGNGKRLFQNQRAMQKLQLLSAKNFDTGLVQLHYQTI